MHRLFTVFNQDLCIATAHNDKHTSKIQLKAVSKVNLQGA